MITPRWLRAGAFAALFFSASIQIRAESFVAPYSGNLYLQCVGGTAAAVSTFGVGTSPTTFTPYLTGLPSHPSPSGQALVGAIAAGGTVIFGISTVWNNQTYWAFSNATDQASLVAFSDIDNSLHMGGKIIEQTSQSTWLMHFDDAASYLFDDNDADILIQLTLVPTGPPVLLLQGSLSFTCLSGTSPPTQALTVSGNIAMLFTASASSSGNWLTVNPTNGTTPTAITVSVSAANLPPGTYTGTISVSSPSATNSPQTVQVTVTVQDPYLLSASPTSLAFTYQIGSSQPLAQMIALSSARSGLAFGATASGGTWLLVTPAAGSTPASLSVGVAPGGLSAGTYAGKIIIASSAATNPIQEVPVTLTIFPPIPPVFTSAGIVNAASYAPGLVPGGLAALFGKGLSIVNGTVLAGGRTSLSGTSVSVGGTLAPLLSVTNQAGQEQIDFQVPFELQGSSSTTVQVANNGSSTSVSGVPVLAAQPGIFEVPTDSQGGRTGAVIHLNGQLVAPSSPAMPGEIVSLFLTGLGPVQPAVGTGAFGPIPPATTLLTVTVSIAGVGCNVLFSGYAPVEIGVYQINFQIPTGVIAGPSLKLSVTAGTAISQVSAISVGSI